MDREDWLNRVAERMAPWVDRFDRPLPAFRVAIGFPSTGKRGTGEDRRARSIPLRGTVGPAGDRRAMGHQGVEGLGAGEEKPVRNHLPVIVGQRIPSGPVRNESERARGGRQIIDRLAIGPPSRRRTFPCAERPLGRGPGQPAPHRPSRRRPAGRGRARRTEFATSIAVL
jgi:hypothetical protein